MKKSEKLCYVSAALCLILGALMLFVYTALRFTGFLFFCAAALLVIFALLNRWSGKKRWAFRCRRVLLILLAAGFLFFAIMEVWVVSWSRTDRETTVEAVVVLGAGVNGTAPSLSLLTRLEAALDFLTDKPDIPIIVTGSQGPGEAISEASCMAQWLIAHDVDPARVILEEQANNTEENVLYSKALLAELGISDDASIAVVSSDYHLCRAAWLWGKGMVPAAAHMPVRFLPLTVNYYIREAFGMAAAIVF